MRGACLLMLGWLVLGAGCSRYVVQVEAEPAGAKVRLNGQAGRGDRWAVAQDSAVELVAEWPDGQRLATGLMVDRDIAVILRRDGDRSQVVGARQVGGQLAAPAPVVAAPVELSSDQKMEKARELAAAGQKAFELTDYDVAIDRFKEAYALIGDSQDPKAPEILSNILYNLAVVYERSHDVTPEPERLRRARVMYRQFDEQMAGLVQGWATSAEHADVLARIRAIDARLVGK